MESYHSVFNHVFAIKDMDFLFSGELSILTKIFKESCSPQGITPSWMGCRPGSSEAHENIFKPLHEVSGRNLALKTYSVLALACMWWSCISFFVPEFVFKIQTPSIPDSRLMIRDPISLWFCAWWWEWDVTVSGVCFQVLSPQDAAFQASISTFFMSTHWVKKENSKMCQKKRSEKRWSLLDL